MEAHWRAAAFLNYRAGMMRNSFSNDAINRTPSADLPMSRELETRLRAHLLRHDSVSELLFVNRRGRPLSANKLWEKQLHPLLAKLGIERGGFHSLRHGATSSLLADGATPAVVQRQLRHSDARITLEVYGHVIGDEQGSIVQDRSANDKHKLATLRENRN